MRPALTPVAALALALALHSAAGAAYNDFVVFPDADADADDAWPRAAGRGASHGPFGGRWNGPRGGLRDGPMSSGPWDGPDDLWNGHGPVAAPWPAQDSEWSQRQEIPERPGRYGDRRGPLPGPGPRPRPAPQANANANAGSCGRTIELSRIVGGKDSQLGQFPWQAALVYRAGGSGPEAVLCGGALVSERYVVTAAHCLHETIIKTQRMTTIRLGEWDTSTARDCENWCAPPPLDFAPEHTLLHPGYVAREKPRPGTRHNEADIALVRLDRPAPYTETVRPVCLPDAAAARDDLRDEKALVVAGWGLTEQGSSSKRLRFVQLPGQPLAECGSRLNVDVQPTQLCVGGVEGKDSCTGDSGGPLLTARLQGRDAVYQLVGVVSFGGVCGVKDRPAVYTRVAAFLPWLRENMRP